MDFRDRRVAITGGASGIGLTLAERMAQQGARIAICDMNETGLAKAAELLRTAGAKEVVTSVVDVSHATDLERFVDHIIDQFGGLDVGWNNAGIMSAPRPLHTIDPVEYDLVMAVNLHAVFHGSQLFARHMIAQGTPALIINTGSENSLFHAVPGGGPYVASKMAVRALTESLDQDTPDHIKVQLLCPGFVNTPLGPEAQMQHGMDVERFADIVFPEMGGEAFYLVSHGYNAVRVAEREARLQADIARVAASAEETQPFDTYTLMGLDG